MKTTKSPPSPPGGSPDEPASRARAPKAWIVGAISVAGVLALAAVALAFISWRAGALEEAARRAWRDLPSSSRDAPPAEPNASALALEAEARRLGLEIAPRGSRRARPPRSPAVFARVHESLVAMLRDGALLHQVAPDLDGWCRERNEAIDDLARGMAGRAAPIWGVAGRTGVMRSPPPGERADRLVVEAARIEADPEALSAADEGLTHPGSPRLTSVVLLEELLLIDALQHARSDDRAGSLRSLVAAERLLEGLLAEPDAARLGVVVHLARLHAAALRQLPVDDWPRGLVDTRFRELVPDALAREAALLEASADVRGLPGLVVGPIRRAQMASSRSGVAGIVRRLRDAPCDIQSRSGWVMATEAAPWWDRRQAAYLGDLADLARRAARADLERELTRRVISFRAGREIEPRGACPGWSFSVSGGPGAPRLRHDGPQPALERSMPFEFPLEASP